ncbi:MAG: hypothetical protein ABEN55_01425, partial [Bradymonadaceae bacterium]
MSTRLPIVHVEQIVEAHAADRRDATLTIADLRALTYHLWETEASSPSAAFLNTGFVPLAGLTDPFLLTIADLRLGALGAWAGLLGNAGFSSIAFCAADELDREETVGPADFPLLTGSGVAIASRGTTGRPLIGLPLSELRDELADSHSRLSEAAGFPVRIL